MRPGVRLPPFGEGTFLGSATRLAASVSLFVPSNAPPHSHRGDGSTRGELPTWQPVIRLCFPPGGVLRATPFPPPTRKVQSKGRGAGASRASEVSCGRGESGCSAGRPVTCGNEGENVVSLWPSPGTRTNAAAASEAEFPTPLLGWGWGPVDRAPVLPPQKPSLGRHAVSHQSCTEIERFQSAEGIRRFVKRRKKMLKQLGVGRRGPNERLRNHRHGEGGSVVRREMPAESCRPDYHAEMLLRADRAF